MRKNKPLQEHLSAATPALQNWWHGDKNENPCLIAAIEDSTATVDQHENMVEYWTDGDLHLKRFVDRYNQSTYYGQAVPYHYIDFGASAMPCMLGAVPEYINRETIWAHANCNKLDQILEIDFQHSNHLFKTSDRVLRESMALADQHHLIACYALGGIGDNLIGLYGAEQTLVAMVNQPEQIMRVLGHLTELWIEYFNDFQKKLSPIADQGGIGWPGIWAPGSTFPIQEDFSYMISPQMFDQFCIPRIMDLISVMSYPFYHLDGTGSLVHLDSLLAIEALNVIQWVPGAGREEIAQWYELLQYIISRGKSIQVYARAEEIDDLVKKVGGEHLVIIVTNAEHESMQKLCQKYGVN